ncbi:MAG TPA: LPS export ABC transporter permease LptF [Gammaproteobacteria bacterium]|nr:LPS export ABC transporter permease LptF [Gammaproteobacteria bacterium]
MLSRIDRYILREVGQTWAAATGVLMLILVSSRYVRFLSDAAAGKLSQDVIFHLLGLVALQYFTVLIPAALFVAIILAFGRLYRDSEFTALAACGIGPARLYRPLLLLAGAVAVLLAVLAFWLSPWSQRQSYEVRHAAERAVRFGAVAAGQFKAFDSGKSVFYAEGTSDNGRELRNVFIRTTRNGEPVVIFAARGEQRIEPGARVLVLVNGFRYSGSPGSADFRIVHFHTHGIRYQLPQAGNESNRHSIKSTAALIASSDPGDKAELRWRLSIPLSALVLTLLALPLAHSGPRQGRSARVLLGLLVYMVYSNLLSVGQSWIADGQVPPAIGLLWVHALGVAAAFALLARQNGWAWMLGMRGPWRRLQ